MRVQHRFYSWLAHLIPGCVTLGKLLKLIDFLSLQWGWWCFPHIIILIKQCFKAVCLVKKPGTWWSFNKQLLLLSSMIFWLTKQFFSYKVWQMGLPVYSWYPNSKWEVHQFMQRLCNNFLTGLSASQFSLF